MPRRTRRSVRSWLTSSPPKRIAPRQLGMSPSSVLSSVVLPAPLAPGSTTVSRARTSRSTPHSTLTRAWLLLTASASSSVSGLIAVPHEHIEDALVVDGVGHDALEDPLAGVHDDDAVGDLVDEAHEMLDDEESDAVLRQLLQALGDAAE